MCVSVGWDEDTHTHTVNTALWGKIFLYSGGGTKEGIYNKIILYFVTTDGAIISCPSSLFLPPFEGLAAHQLKLKLATAGSG